MRLSHLPALAVLAALAVALFAALPSASAEPLGACSPTGTNYLKIGDTCTITAASGDLLTHASATDKVVASLSDAGNPAGSYGDPAATPTAGDPKAFTAGQSEVTVTANAIGTITITDTNESTGLAEEDDTTFKIEVVASGSLEVIFDDTDATVKAGTEVQVGIRVRAATGGGEDDEANTVAVTLKAPNTGVYFLETGTDDGGTDDTTTQIAPASVVASAESEQMFASRKLQTAGAPAGDYVITATLADDIGNLKKGNYTATLTIGDPGAGLASANLALDTGQKSSNSISTPVGLVATAKNSLGANSNSGDVASILVNATGGTIVFSTCGAEAAQREKTNFAQLVEETTGDTAGRADTNCDGTVAAPSDPEVATDDKGVGSVVKFTVNKTTAGTVDVQVTMIGGAAGTASSETITLTFAGTAEAIAVGTASNNLAQKAGEITFEVTATDKGGNAAEVNANAITTVLKDAEGNTPQNLTVSDAQKFTDSNANGDKDAGEDDVTTAVIVTVESDPNNNAEAGHYTVEVLLNNDASTKQVGSFTVVGGAANVDVSSDSAMVAVGDIITLTATITDADGNAVTNPASTETNVDFSTAGALKLAGFGANDNGVVKKASKDGVAEAKFVVTNGSGTAVILVNSGSATGTTSVSTEPVAMAEEEMGLSCLSAYNAFSTYTCAQDSSASELFDLVFDRGATAIHLWNGTAWVRYSVVEGAMVPGSTDFPVSANETLYISY